MKLNRYRGQAMIKTIDEICKDFVFISPLLPVSYPEDKYLYSRIWQKLAFYGNDIRTISYIWDEYPLNILGFRYSYTPNRTDDVLLGARLAHFEGVFHW